MSKRAGYGTVLIQSFNDYEEAEAAVSSLIGAGFTAAEVSLVIAPRVGAWASTDGLARDGNSMSTVADVGRWQHIRFPGGPLAGEERAEVPGVGLVIGGPLVPVLDGSKGYGLSGALRELGVGKEEADYYRRRLEAGEAVVVAVMGRSSQTGTAA